MNSEQSEIPTESIFAPQTYTREGKTIHYYAYFHENPTTRPTMIFLHGFMDNGMCYDRVAEQFADRFNILLPDARGHGKSSDPPDGFSYEEFCQDVIDLCEKYQVSQPIIMGHSMGGAEAATLGTMIPVRAIIMEDPGFTGKNRIRLGLSIGAFFMKLFFPHRKEMRPYEKHLSRSQKLNKKWAARDQAVWAHAQQEWELHYIAKNMKILGLASSGDEIIPQLNCPALLISSEKGIVSKMKAEKWQSLNPRLTWVHIMEAGHNIRREQFDQEINAINEFLAKHEI